MLDDPPFVVIVTPCNELPASNHVPNVCRVCVEKLCGLVHCHSSHVSIISCVSNADGRVVKIAAPIAHFSKFTVCDLRTATPQQIAAVHAAAEAMGECGHDDDAPHDLLLVCNQAKGDARCGREQHGYWRVKQRLIAEELEAGMDKTKGGLLL